MQSSRRRFLKIAGVSALGLGVIKPVTDALAASSSHSAPQPEMLRNAKALIAKRWGMVIDTRKITSEHDVEPMISACHLTHNVPKHVNPRHEIKWIWTEEFKHAFPTDEHELVSERIKHTPFPVLCNHCQNPPCVRVCPTKATFQRDDGIVMMDMHRCIGCRFCMAACPYGSRSFNFLNPVDYIPKKNLAYPTRMKGVVEKCTFCAERLAVGQKPACVEASNGIMAFGDLDDPHSDVRKLLESNYAIRRKPNLGTGPSVYYIV